MTDEFGEFTNFITKGFGTEETNDGRRIVKGHITVEVVDRQNEYVAVNEVLAIIKNYFDVYPAIHDWHSNRPVGKALKYEKSEIDGHASVYIEAEIFKKEGVTLYDKVWQKIVKGEYTGFSMGGASMIREPTVKDGKLVTSLKSLELYEISVCPLPANPLAIFDYVNDFAKAAELEIHKADDGRQYIQCDGVLCQYRKNAYGNESKEIGEKEDIPQLPDKKTPQMNKTDETTTMVTPVTVAPKYTDFRTEKDKSKFGVEKTDVLMKAIDGMAEELIKQYEAFNKPIRGHSWSHWQNKLKEENPEYTDEQVGAIIGSWEKEEKNKSKITKEMSRRAQTVMDDAPKGDENKMVEDQNRDFSKADVEFKANTSLGKKEWEFWQIDMETYEKVSGTEQTVLSESYGQAIDDYIACWNTKNPENTTGYPMVQGRLKSDYVEDKSKPDLAGRVQKDHIPSMTEEQEKKMKPNKTEDEMSQKETVIKDSGQANSQGKTPHVKNYPQKDSIENKEMEKTSGNKNELYSIIRKNSLINILLN